MKHLILLACPLLFTSCGLANKLIQAPMRLLESGARTLSDAGQSTSPATREATDYYGIAVKNTEEVAP